MKLPNDLKKWVRAALAVAAAILLLTGVLPETAQKAAGSETAQTENLTAKKKKKTPTPAPAAAVTAASEETAAPEADLLTPTPVPDGPIIDPQSIADYIFANGCLPDNFITKREAQDLGWDSSCNYVSDVAPGKSIGGDRFGNYEGLLPTAKGRQYYECDCFYTGGRRSAYRIIFSNDGLVYYTEDHYQSFTQMFPGTKPTAVP